MTTALLLARDSKSWDRYIDGAQDGSILQSWAWGELKSRYGWQPTRYFWTRDGVIRGAVSVLRRPLPGGLSMYYAPHGPVLDRHLREWPAFWSELRAQLSIGRGTILKVEPQWNNSDALILQETGARHSASIQHRATAIIDLSGGEQVFARMSGSARRNMRLAQRAGVTINASTDPGAIDLLYDLLEQTAERQRFTVRSRQYYRDVFASFQDVAIYLAQRALPQRDRQTPLAASMMVRYGKRLVYLFSGSSDEGRDLKAPYLIQQEAIRDAQGLGCTSYDLWGMPLDPQPGDAGWGYAHFKTMLGATPVRFSGAWDLPIRRTLASAYHLAERMMARGTAAA